VSRQPVPLGDHTDILSGFAFPSDGFNTEEGIPLIRIRDVIRGTTETRFRGEYDPTYVVTNGDTLIGMDGEFNVGTWQSEPALLNQRVCRIKARATVDQRYLFHFLPEALKSIEERTSFVTVKHLSVKDIRAIAIPLPPIEEQRRIAAILDEAEALRAKRRQALTKLDTLTQSLFLEMFGEPLSNPKNWPKLALGDLLVLHQYGPRFYNETYTESGIKIVRITDLDSRGKLDFSEMPKLNVSESDQQKFLLKPGDIVFARTGATVGKLGRIRKGDPPCIAGAYFIRLRFHVDKVEPDYAQYVLASPRMQATIAKQSRQAAQQNFSGPALRRLQIPLPSIALQRSFAQHLRQLDGIEKSINLSHEKLDHLFPSLQHRAFRGEL
jgi:type I restriction enzyme S subunit